MKNRLRAHIHWNNIGSALLALMTLLAVAPYDLGQVSTLFPPGAKPWVFLFGALGTCASRMFGEKKESAPTPTVIQNFYTINASKEKSAKLGVDGR